MAQIARGGGQENNWYLGFNISQEVLLAAGLEDAHGSRRARGGGSAGFFSVAWLAVALSRATAGRPLGVRPLLFVARRP